MDGTIRINATLCRHTADTEALPALKALLQKLPQRAPQLLAESNVPIADYDVLLKMAVESLRGTQSANPKAKQRFISGVLTHMRTVGAIEDWGFVGYGGRQDYDVVLRGGRRVAIEAKGCGDGNNMGIWDRPPWAQEFIIWSLCPESLQHQPGRGVWSAISTRLTPKIIHENQQVDAFVFYDQRCGSELRPCPKAFGVSGLRHTATEVQGQEVPAGAGGGCGADWLPPPSIYLFPETVPQAPNNPSPRPHSVESCHFARAMLAAFNVPLDQMPELVHYVHIDVQLRSDGRYRRVSLFHGRDSEPVVQSGWEKLKR